MMESQHAQLRQRMQNVRPSIEGNAAIFSFLRGEQTIYHPTQNRELNFDVIDFENLDNNDFDVTCEWTYTNGRYTNRVDIVFLINGIASSPSRYSYMVSYMVSLFL